MIAQGLATITPPHRLSPGLLHAAPLFAGLSAPTLDQLAGAFETVAVRAGDVVCRKGEPGHALFVVIDGALRIHDGDVVLNVLGPGDCFGELAALDASPRSASITAASDALLARLDGDVLRRFIRREPSVAASVIHGLCDSIRHRVDDVTAGARRRQALEHELEIGRKIQAGFLPRHLPEIAGWEIAAHFQAAYEVAGDFYDLFAAADGRIAFVIGDVCDKGVGAALFMTLFRSLIRAGAKMGEFLPAAESARRMGAPATLMNGVRLANDYIAKTHGDAAMFATLFFGLLDPGTGRLAYINAGHEAPWLLRARGPDARLEVTGPAVGLRANAGFRVQEAVLEPGDTLFAYTDGVTNASDPSGQQLAAHLTRYRIPAAPLLKRIAQAVGERADGSAELDDVTMLALTRAPRR
jgi:serine phosphatase RsbU (regulator of sigma subunit)